MATYRFNIPSSGGTYTAATLDSECEIENQISVSGNTIFNEIVTPSSIVFDGTNLVFTAKASQATSEREGYAEVNYTIHGNECKKYMHLVQEAPPTPKATLRLSNGTTVTVPCDGNSTLNSTDITRVVDASQVVSVHVEDCVTKIGDGAFVASTFTSLTSITMADSVTEIGEDVHNAPYGGAPLKSISFSNNLVSIGKEAFWGCDKLTSLNFPNTLTHLYDSCFRGCNGLTSVTIPDSVKVIGFDAFHLCDGLKEVTIGTGWTGTTKNGRSFENCGSLMKVTVKATSPASINDIYYFCDSRVMGRCWQDGFKILVPRNSVDTYKRATYWSNYEDVIEPIS